MPDPVRDANGVSYRFVTDFAAATKTDLMLGTLDFEDPLAPFEPGAPRCSRAAFEIECAEHQVRFSSPRQNQSRSGSSRRFASRHWIGIELPARPINPAAGSRARDFAKRWKRSKISRVNCGSNFAAAAHSPAPRQRESISTCRDLNAVQTERKHGHDADHRQGEIEIADA